MEESVRSEGWGKSSKAACPAGTGLCQPFWKSQAGDVPNLKREPECAHPVSHKVGLQLFLVSVCPSPQQTRMALVCRQNETSPGSSFWHILPCGGRFSAGRWHWAHTACRRLQQISPAHPSNRAGPQRRNWGGAKLCNQIPQSSALSKSSLTPAQLL